MPSIGLTLYQIAARKEPLVRPDWPERPPGRLAWLHAPTADLAPQMAELARHIREEDGHPVLLTAPELPAALPDGAIWQAPPGESAAGVRLFLDHWRPDVVLFSGGELRPSILHEAAERRIPMAMLAARAPHLPPGRDGWYPGLVKSALADFTQICAVDDAAARSLRRSVAANRISVAGRLEEPSHVLPGNEAEREALAHLFAARPVWLAACLPEAEETAVIEAHRAALRQAHRLLLILVPEDPARAPLLAHRMEEAEGWQVAQRSADEEPEPDTEVFLADTSEMGLWYRLAPICFLGGSLAGTGCIRNPMEAAALGASLIHGPRPGAWGAALGRLGAARGARSVASAPDLAEAVAELLAPDRAALLARAAWIVSSEGTEATAQALALMRQLLGEG
ncbi:3-deoxy-D-manno-octulosonic-acid transferase [Gemmobacter caeni]|uniref:3-deoxy-D-manno-octulosonic acid transferase n=1 Tax=Gemmobacter caeni TaxID=589035 RepID=A0A2T6ATD6_9RHOB|nr:glycosyltransferase N-terminal domain-containing protein [Gemmobacter caeni]PTX47089.1 3-deoxy-D-manno-octulosonic-acid transferase [Gemmobacter caeni]TWI96054.1 3-deoxy-D-manno-octulosonic-acid transferase [Gemmobacter caeni]